MRAGELDPDQNVAGFEAVALAAFHLDKVIAEGTEHRLGDGVERQLHHRVGKGGVYLFASHLAEVAACLAA